MLGLDARAWGWLLGVIESDAGIYRERVSKDSDGHHPVFDLETTNVEIAVRVAEAIGARAPRVRPGRPSHCAGWTSELYRVRLRGRSAALLLRAIREDCTTALRARIDAALRP